jgi:surface polysaccharide O-acyltransferase-like enzyme
MFIQAMARFFFGMGVPLFIILTGYLNTRKVVSAEYYKGCIRVLFSYILISIVAVIFRKYYLHEPLSWVNGGGYILNFEAIMYAWYIEMWIGLFLLTPFLNILYKHIPTRRQKQILIITLFIMTALPNFCNRYGLYLLPEFWKQCYPLLFFFIGCYIHEYKPTINIKFAWGIIIGICLINPIFNTLFVHHRDLIEISGNPQRDIFGVVMATVFFLLLYKWNCDWNFIKKALNKISVLSLDMYLFSYMFDAAVYPVFLEHYFVNQSQFAIYFFVIIPILFLGAFWAAWFKNRLIRIKYLS